MKRFEKLIAFVGALLITLGIYIAPPLRFGSLPCNIKPFSAKPTTILDAEKTGGIIATIKADTTIQTQIDNAVSYIDSKQGTFKTGNGKYFKI